MFEAILLFFAKVGFAIILFIFLVRWFFVIPYLYFRYDKPIMMLKNELDEFRTRVRKEPIPLGSMEGQISYKDREASEKLELLEIRRRLFLDRVNLLLSIISVDKK